MKLRGILLGTAIAVLLPSAAMAAEGFYVGLEGGASFAAADPKVKDAAIGSWKAKLNTGYAVGGSVGYASATGLRGEIELSYRSLAVSGGTTIGLPSASSSGDFGTFAAMGNLFYDIKTGTPFTPYVGAGLGVAVAHNTITVNSTGTNYYRLGGNDTVLAYQGIVGVAYNFTDNLALSLDYRYFGTQDQRLKANYLVGTTSGQNMTDKISNVGTHNVMVGLRYSFGAPSVPAPQPPAPPVAQAPQTEYQVFFDWDKANITPVSDKIIGDAAAAAGKLRAVGIRVVGHTDTSGSPAYNVKLSVRRAEAVKKALVAKGVPAKNITTEGVGEKGLLVPTGPNVREPSNRRAQIIILVK